MLHETSAPSEKALLVGIQLPGVGEQECADSLAELARLVDTLGFRVVGSLAQKRPSLAGAVIVGEGKLAEIASWTGGSGHVGSLVKRKMTRARERWAEDAAQASAEDDGVAEGDGIAGDDAAQSLADDAGANRSDEGDDAAERDGGAPQRADVLVFDCELTPSQTRNLESACGVRVLDRTGVIIEIFSRHARTRAARLQVEIARLAYLAPRLRETGGGGDRQGGGIGGKGAGESAVELDRRRIRDRIKELRRELEAILAEQADRRKRRAQVARSAALVGYTNAGKSSLMRAMTGSDVYIANKLFATLETTVRPIWPEVTPPILLSDTVGFIKKLPHDLVASFRSTLDEALNASLLLFVVDASDPFPSQLETTRQTLAEVGASDAPAWVVLNKRDLLPAEERARLAERYPEAIFISTREAGDLRALRARLIEHFDQGMEEAILHVRFDAKGAVGEVRSRARVLDESYDERGARLRVRAPAEALAQILRKFPEGIARVGDGDSKSNAAASDDTAADAGLEGKRGR
jgi:GTP-binding protein HflX